jgi:hypothetical protein
VLLACDINAHGGSDIRAGKRSEELGRRGGEMAAPEQNVPQKTKAIMLECDVRHRLTTVPMGIVYMAWSEKKVVVRF